MSEVSKAQQVARQQAITAQRVKMERRSMQQVESSRVVGNLEDEEGFDVVLMKRQFEPLEELKTPKKTISKSQFADEEVEIVEDATNLDGAAFKFNKRNFELKTKTLLILRDSITDEDSVEDILRKVLEFYPDYTLADDALDFLLDTTKGTLAQKVLLAKNYLNAQYKREIVAGRNINFQAQTFSKVGLGSPSALRDMYRDITGNPRTPYTLFDELNSKFSYDSMKVVIRFLLHSLGADLKSKGPSITKPELIRLIEDTQILQSILGVFRFFISRQNLINSQFDHFGLVLPKNLNFELISKLFISLLKERYITSEKILLLSKYLGISQELIAQIIIFSQMRDAIRNTSSRLYKSDKQRQEVLTIFIETLEELEEKLEESQEA